MKDILKMCRYYLVSGSSGNQKFILLFLLISVISGLIGVPVGCISFCISPVLTAAPEVYGDKDIQRIFAVLPVSRGTVLRGEFAATLGFVLLGQIPSVLFLALCSWCPLFGLLPEKIAVSLMSVRAQFSLGTIAAIAFFSALICVGYSLCSMLLHTHGMNITITVLSVFLGVVMIGVIILFMLNDKGIIDISNILNFSLSDNQRALVIILSNAVSVVTGFICCERTAAHSKGKQT